MRIDVLTLFPQMFDGLLSCSIIGRAMEHGLVDIKLHDIRAYTHDKHNTVDDYPYGGGAGMVLKPEPIFEAVEGIKGELGLSSVSTVLLSPQGRLFNQEIARELAGCRNLVLICGHYEGVDERVAEHLISDEISIGDYLLSGGEVAAMAVIDAVIRLVPGVLGDEQSSGNDSFSGRQRILEYAQYTRPREYRGLAVPEVLLSGDHQQIAQWREDNSRERTQRRRADLLHQS